MIETATTADLDRVVELWVALVEAGRADGVHLRAERNRTEARRQLAEAAAERRVLVARERQIVGFASVAVRHGRFESDATRGRIENLYVVPGRRGEGIGSDLLSAATERLAEFGADIVVVQTPAENEAARRFYRNWGFEPHRIELERRL